MTVYKGADKLCVPDEKKRPDNELDLIRVIVDKGAARVNYRA